MKPGERVTLTARGLTIAKARRLLPSDGEVRDVFHVGLRSEQVYVKRDRGGSEWWPVRAWALAGRGPKEEDHDHHTR